MTKSKAFIDFLKYFVSHVDRNQLNKFVGTLAATRFPPPVQKIILNWYMKRFEIQEKELAQPLETYSSLSDFFVRDLPPQARPLSSGMIHPVDGFITTFGDLQAGQALQAKGKSYSVPELLAGSKYAELLIDGSYVTYYLSPSDYHHIHCPIDASVAEAILVPGDLWPVNDWSSNLQDDLFLKNERIISFLETEKGPMAVVMVGAIVVGKMSVSYDPSLVSNCAKGDPIRKIYSTPHRLAKGERLGTFHLGSTVILIYPKNYLSHLNLKNSGRIQWGTQLGSL